MNKRTAEQIVKNICPNMELGNNWNANLVLRYAPGLTSEQRNLLVPHVEKSMDAAWVLRAVLDLTSANRDLMVRRIKDSYNASLVLRYAPGLTYAQRGRLEQICNKED